MRPTHYIILSWCSSFEKLPKICKKRTFLYPGNIPLKQLIHNLIGSNFFVGTITFLGRSEHSHILRFSWKISDHVVILDEIFPRVDIVAFMLPLQTDQCRSSQTSDFLQALAEDFGSKYSYVFCTY